MDIYKKISGNVSPRIPKYGIPKYLTAKIYVIPAFVWEEAEGISILW